MEARVRAIVEEAAQQGQHLGQGAEIADDDAQLALLAHRQLPGVIAQLKRLLQEGTGALVEGAAFAGQRHPVAVAVEQAQAKLLLEIPDRGEDGGMRAPEFGGAGLEAALGDHGVETLQLVERQTVHGQSPIV